MTIDGSEDQLIKPQGLGDYVFWHWMVLSLIFIFVLSDKNMEENQSVFGSYLWLCFFKKTVCRFLSSCSCLRGFTVFTSSSLLYQQTTTYKQPSSIFCPSTVLKTQFERFARPYFACLEVSIKEESWNRDIKIKQKNTCLVVFQPPFQSSQHTMHNSCLSHERGF